MPSLQLHVKALQCLMSALYVGVHASRAGMHMQHCATDFSLKVVPLPTDICKKYLCWEFLAVNWGTCTLSCPKCQLVC